MEPLTSPRRLLRRPLPEELGIKIHIGALIRKELGRRNLTVKWLAHEICCDRTNVYKILRKRSIDTDLLVRISLALTHDFFNDLRGACGFHQD